MPEQVMKNNFHYSSVIFSGFFVLFKGGELVEIIKKLRGDSS